jgi:hypothetical protein
MTQLITTEMEYINTKDNDDQNKETSKMWKKVKFFSVTLRNAWTSHGVNTGVWTFLCYQSSDVKRMQMC